MTTLIQRKSSPREIAEEWAWWEERKTGDDREVVYDVYFNGYRIRKGVWNLESAKDTVREMRNDIAELLENERAD